MLGLSPDSLLLLIGVGMLTAVIAAVARASHRNDPAQLGPGPEADTDPPAAPSAACLPPPRTFVTESPRPPWSR